MSQDNKYNPQGQRPDQLKQQQQQKQQQGTQKPKDQSQQKQQPFHDRDKR